MPAAACSKSSRRPVVRQGRLTFPEGTAGLRHLTFLFESVDETFARLEQAGVEVKERPRLAVNAEVLHKVAFLRDPDGIQIELAEKRSSVAAVL